MSTLAAALPGENLPEGHARFFPDEAHPATALGSQDIACLTDGLSAVYAAAAAGVAEKMSERLDLPPAAARVLARDPMVLLTHLILDRMFRLKRLVDREGRAVLRAPRGELKAPALLTELGQAAVSSRAFNEALLGRVAAVWHLETAASATAPAMRASKPIANLNFAAPDLVRRVVWKSRRVSSRLAGRIPALGLAYAESCFLDAGLIGPGHLADLHGAADAQAPAADKKLRREVVAAGCLRTQDALGALLASQGFDASEREDAVRAHAELCAELFPRARLEGLEPRMKTARKSLSRFSRRSLVLSEVGDERTACMLAAARSLGMPVVGIQHGAHYGFVDAPCHIELEYAHLDRFVTWGWSRLPAHPLCERLETIPLPSPWMSERAKRWRRELPAPGTKSARWDALLMTERIPSFPATLTTVRLNRLDILPVLDADLSGLVSALTAAGLKVLHKPFNATSAEAQSEAIATLAAAHGKSYAAYDRLDKGMSPELLSSVGMVVWDEPGGGLFECLVSGVPTLLLWNQSRYPASPRADAPFRALEEAGICHRTPESLAAAAAELRRDPAAWLAQPRRARLIAQVCRELSWADDDLARPWRRFLDAL